MREKLQILLIGDKSSDKLEIPYSFNHLQIPYDKLVADIVQNVAFTLEFENNLYDLSFTSIPCGDEYKRIK